MSDEQFLIEFANLSRSAAIAPSRYTKPRNSVMDETSLIAAADLSHSEKDRLLRSLEQPCYINRYAESEEDYDEYGEEEEEVVDDYDDNDEEEIKRNIHTDSSIQTPPTPCTEDRRRIQLTEDILITYAHLSDNQLRAVTKENIQSTFEGPAIVNSRLKVPRLDIRSMDNDDEQGLDMDGLEASNDSKDAFGKNGQPVEERKPRRIVINEGVSPGRPLYRDADAAHVDEEFNTLLIDTANAMNSIEFDDIKTMLLDTAGIGPILVAADSPITALNRLGRYKTVTPDNLHILQRVIASLGNPLLHARARQYVTQRGQTVFFHPDTADVLPGFETFKCRVSGKDFTWLTRNDLETLRSTVSRLLFIPADSVYIVGIEPGINLVISLMVPQRFITTLTKLVTDGRLLELGAIGVDLLQISGTTFKTQGQPPMVSTGQEHTKFLTIYQQARDKNKHLEEKDREIAELKEEIEFVKLELETKSAELEMVAYRMKQDSWDWPNGRDRQPVRRRRSLPTMARGCVTNTAIPVARQHVDAGNKIAETGKNGRVNGKSTTVIGETCLQDDDFKLVKQNEKVGGIKSKKKDTIRTGRKVFFADNVNKNEMGETAKHEKRDKDSGNRTNGETRKSDVKSSSFSDKQAVNAAEGPLKLDWSFGARSRGFEWTRDDISALTSVRRVIERGELMDDIEALLSELGIAGN